MTDFSLLEKPPFNLDADALTWVKRAWDSLDDAGRVSQLFNLISLDSTAEEYARIKALRPGGITRFFGPDGDAERDGLARMQQDANIPLLVSADLEGSRMSLPFGTQVPNPLALAAVDDPETTAEISRIMAVEARAVGVNWSFTPVLDINEAFRSAIVATRGFGSDPDRIARHALIQARVFQENGVAATVKHWPGEGFDDRDQHLLTTINPLSMEDWRATFGRLYGAAVDAGVLSVMSAHIALPSFVRAQDPTAGIEAFRPASISHLLNHTLLREDLGFNGLIVSDASEMAGLTSWVAEPESKVELIANGCDMVLFSNDPEADMAAIADAVRTGRIPETRLRDAVLRILGLKAALGLHRTAVVAPPVRTDAQAYSDTVLRRAPTLVKDTQSLLPLNPDRHHRVLVISGGVVDPLRNGVFDLKLPDMMADAGFAITLHDPEVPVGPEDFDLVLYLFGEEPLLTRGRIFLDWAKLGGGFRGAMQRLWHKTPTAMISFGYPYYLYDAPRVPTYINAYCSMDEMQAAVLDLLLGQGAWNLSSPIDPHQGAPDSIY